MSKPLLWVEARCEGMHEFGKGCHETGPGEFFSSIQSAVKFTKRGGWVIIKGEWYCPVCKAKKKGASREGTQ